MKPLKIIVLIILSIIVLTGAVGAYLYSNPETIKVWKAQKQKDGSNEQPSTQATLPAKKIPTTFELTLKLAFALLTIFAFIGVSKYLLKEFDNQKKEINHE